MKNLKTFINRLSPGDWIVWFSAVVLLGTWLISLQIVINERKLELSRAQRETENLSIILERHIHETFSRIEATLFTMREQWESGAGKKEMREFLNNKVTANPILFNLISVIDKNGNVIVTDKKEFNPTFSGDRPFFIHHKEINSPYLRTGSPILGRVTGKWYIPVSLRLRNKGGGFDGVLLASINPYYFSMIFQEVKLGEKSLVYLADYKGIIYSGMLGNEDIGLDKVIHPHIISGFTDADNSPPEIVSICLDGVERIFSRKSVKDRTMFVSVGVSLDELLEQWKTRSIILMTAQFIISSIILIFMFRLRKAIISKDEVTEELNRFFSASLELFCIADLKGNFRRVNKEWENILGYSAEYLEKKSFLEFIHPDDIQSTLDAINDLAGSKTIYNFINRYRCRDGSYRYIEWRSTLHENFIYVAARDITDRKFAGEALQESEAKFRSIIENSPVGYYIYSIEKDDKLVFRMYNPAADAIIGISHEQFIGCDILQAFPALAGTGIPEMYKAVAKGELETQNFEIEYDSGEIKGVYEVRVFQGEPGQAVVNFADIKERRQMEQKQIKLTEQLHQSQKMEAIGQLAGGIAHDFNNILAGIIGFAELLQVTESLSEKQKKYTSKIITAADRAGNLAKKLLTFSRRGIKASSTIDCAKIIIDTIEILKRTIDKKIELSFENKAEISLIAGDDSILQNVFLNISINAAQAMPHGGKLIFSIDNVYLERDYCDFLRFDIQSGEFVEIIIRDTGTGMPQEVLSRIFEPFFTTKDPGKGTGLGLAMVYSAIQEHSGAINVYSVEGRGTVFHIYLPVSEHAQIDAISPHPLTRGSGTILLIDDEELMRLSAAAMLESIGYNVIQAENGKHGLEIFEKQSGKISLVILDMVMPVMGGRETFTKIREINPHMPVIISSGFAREEDMISIKDQGLSGFLQKPFRSAELAEAVNLIISKNLPPSPHSVHQTGEGAGG